MYPHPVGQNSVLSPPEIDLFFAAAQAEDIIKLREQYRCQHFRILVIGRANAGKTTILEKVCGIAKGTKPITILDEKGKLDENFMHSLKYILFHLGAELASSETHLRPSIEVS